MLEATKLIINRMETNPEEFYYRESKWASLINYHETCLPKEDLDAIIEGLKKCRQQEYMGEVMKALVHEHDLHRGRQYEIGGIPIKPELIDYQPVVETEGFHTESYDSATDSFRYTLGGR